MTMKKIFRSKTDRMISGVCGGFGEYFSVDSTLIRLGVAFLTLITGIVPGVILYILAALIVPERN